MASELLTGLGVFKSLLDMTKGLKDMNDTAVRNAAVIELQGNILTAQEQQTALIERVRDLEKAVARFETWNTEKERYELTDFGSGTFAYVLKPGVSSGEPSHRICAACYQNGHKSILQFRYKAATSQDKFTCPACKTDFLLGVPSNDPPVVQTGRSMRSWTDR